MICDQAEFDLRCEWGLAPKSSSAFQQTKGHLPEPLCWCSCGQSLIARGFVNDVELASQLHISKTVPRLINYAYVHSATL